MRLADMFDGRRLMLATIVAAILAGLLGSLIGTRLGRQVDPGADPFATTVVGLLNQESGGLDAGQQARLDTMIHHYEAERRESGRRLRAAIIALARVTTNTTSSADVIETTALAVDSIVHERRMRSIAFMREARQILAEAERGEFDAALLNLVTRDPTYPR
jgi:hypothetical protein